MDIEAYLSERARLLDRLLDAELPPADAPPADLHRAMRHMLFPAGKRFRPALALAAAEAVGGRLEAALRLAGAVELVHTYSLVHDDLPCMDDDALRRGRPTVHVAFGEALALLAGDALLAAAFELLAGDAELPAETVRQNLLELARAAGSNHLVGGQVDDLARVSDDGGGPERVEAVHRRKTAALIAAAVVGGARAGGASEFELGSLRRYGGAVGIAFQIADDLLDRRDDPGCSLVRARGVDGARRRAGELLEVALVQIEGWGERAEPLRELARFAVWRER